MVLSISCLILLLAVLAACLCDVRYMRIPNACVIVILLAFGPAFAAAPEAFHPLWSHLAAMLVFLAVTYVMFAIGMLGAGDAKLGAALALWVGLPSLVIYLFYMALVGGLLGIAALLLKRFKPVAHPKPESWVARAQAGESRVPYGIAIGVGAGAALFHSGFLSHALRELIKIIH